MSARRVLIAEDQAVFSQLLEKWLTAAGLEVQKVENGLAAVAAARDWLPDLILMDLRMPVLDGFEAARRIRADAATSRIPMVATTSLDHPDDVLRALSSGFNKYLRKPYDAKRILAEIEEVLFFSERRQRIVALAPHVLRGTGRAMVKGDQRQVLQEFFHSVQRLVPCDVLALGWRRGPASGLVVVCDAAELSPGILQAVSSLAWHETDLKVWPEPTVVAGSGARVHQELGATSVQSVLLDGERVAALVVGRLNTRAFSADEGRVLERLSPLVGRACQVCQLDPGPDVPAERVVHPLRAVLVSDAPTALADAAALERAVDGLSLRVLPSLAALTNHDDGVHVAFVTAQLLAGAAGWNEQHHRPPVVKLEPSVLNNPLQLAAWVLMSVLIALMDSRRSGTLHVLRRGGGFAGLLVFKEGRLAWGTAEGAQADLLRVLELQCGAPRSALLGVVKRCQEQGWALATGLEREGLADRSNYEGALKTYLSLLTGELLRETRPVVYWSELVSVGHNCPTFDVGEISMSGMVP